MTRQEETYYEILGVPRDASARDITASYRRLAKVLHPDVCPSPDAEELFKSINEAYQTLNDVKRREEYDASLAEAGDSPYREYYQGSRRYRDPRTWYYTHQTGSGRRKTRPEESRPQQPVSAIPRYIQVILFYLTLLMGVLIIAQLFLIPWIGGMNAAGAREALSEGNRWMEEREFQKAIESYETATARLPSFSEAWRAKGLAEVQKADELTSLGQSGAEAYYREAIRSLGRVSDGEDLLAKKGMARSLMMTGELRRALSVLTSIPRESADAEVTGMIMEVNSRIHPGTHPRPSP